MRRAPHKLAAILAAGAILVTGCSTKAALQAGASGLLNGLMNCAVTGTAANITPAQNKVASDIVKVALELGTGQRGAQLGVVTALTESTLTEVPHGDAMGPSSKGPFQQMDPWGPYEERMSATGSATLFFKGGKVMPNIPGDGHERGVLDIDGWQTMTIPAVAQMVQGSEFTDGSNYQKNLALGSAIADQVMGTEGPKCTPTGGSKVTTIGVNVTIPDNEFVAAPVRGKTIIAPFEGMATGLAAGFDQLGLPYVWGGSDANGGGPDNGCSRGGGDLNSCGTEIGFDCSGLTSYVTVAAGLPGPGTNSAAQRAGNHDTPWEDALPGDILGRSGHVAIYLGDIDGTKYILEASTPGVPIHIVSTTQGAWDGVVHRTWESSQA